MKIYLIRHGQKKPLIGDPGLTKKGKEQAQKVANYLKGLGIKQIISSPAKRTVETAGIIAMELGLTFITNNLLRKRLVSGISEAEMLLA